MEPVHITGQMQPVQGPRELDARQKLRLQHAVQEFEAVLVGYMLKSMRASIPRDEQSGEGYGADLMEGMFDIELARHVSRGSSLGLGEMLYKRITGEEMPGRAPASPGRIPDGPSTSVADAARTRGSSSASGADAVRSPGGSSASARDAVRSPGSSSASNANAARSPGGSSASNADAARTPDSLSASAADAALSPAVPRPAPTPGKEFGPAVTGPAQESSLPDTVRQRVEQLSPIISDAARKHGVDEGLLKAVIATESAGRSTAQSPRKAKGLMQLIDSTAAAMGVRDVWDPQQNVQGGARYLSQLLDRFEGNLEHALASYNAGPGAVDRYGGVPPYKETRAYVERVLQYLRDFEQQESASDDDR